MKQRIICKALVVAVIILFIGLAIKPSIAVQPETEIDDEPKDYLFQTIIDITNNPDVKDLLEQYDNDLFKVDIDRSVYRKLLLRNPRLFCNTLLTKPTMTIEYLNKCYSKGIEITNIIGEEKTLEIIENAEVTDRKLFDEIDDIISKDVELSNRLSTLEDMNKGYISDLSWGFPVICFLLVILVAPFFLWFAFFNELSLIFLLIDNFTFFKIFKIIAYVVFIPLGILVIAMTNFRCFGDEP